MTRRMARQAWMRRPLHRLGTLAVGTAVLATAASALARRPNLRPTDLQRGEELYERHCVACHGDYGRGDGPAATSLVAPIPDLTGVVPDTADMEALVQVVQAGRGAMPGYASSFDRYDTRRVLRHVRRLPEEEREDRLFEPMLGEWELQTRDFKTVRAAVDGLKGKAKEEAERFTNALRAGLVVELREGEWQHRGKGSSGLWDWRLRADKEERLKLTLEGEKGEFDLWMERREDELIVTVREVELVYGRASRSRPGLVPSGGAPGRGPLPSGALPSPGGIKPGSTIAPGTEPAAPSPEPPSDDAKTPASGSESPR